MTVFYYEDVATKLNANMSATRPGTCDVVHVVDLSGTTLAVQFDVRIENEILRVTAIAVDTPSAGIDRWTVSHLGGAAASTHAAGQEVEVIVTAHALNNDVASPDDDSAYMPTAGGTFTGDVEFEGQIIDATEASGSDGQVLTKVSGNPQWAALPSDTDSFLPLTGGTLTGDVEFEAQIIDDTESSGSDGDVLTKVSGHPRWAADSGGGGGSLATLSDVVITSPSDDDSLTYDTASGKWVNEAITGGGGSFTTYDSLIAAMSGLVHRWKFEEASGDFADSVGSLTLVKSGTITYSQTDGPVSGGAGSIKFGASGKGESAGLGSIPTGSAARSFVLVYKGPSGNGKQALFSYGGFGSARIWIAAMLNDGGAPFLNIDTYADDLSAQNVPSASTSWHMMAFTYDGANTIAAFLDGAWYGHYLGGALNTTATGDLWIGQDNQATNQLGTAEFDDLAIFTRALNAYEVNQLYGALAGSLA